MVKAEVHQNHFSWLGIQPFFEILSIAAKCMEIITTIFSLVIVYLPWY